MRWIQEYFVDVCLLKYNEYPFFFFSSYFGFFISLFEKFASLLHYLL